MNSYRSPRSNSDVVVCLPSNFKYGKSYIFPWFASQRDEQEELEAKQSFCVHCALVPILTIFHYWNPPNRICDGEGRAGRARVERVARTRKPIVVHCNAGMFSLLISFPSKVERNASQNQEWIVMLCPSDGEFYSAPLRYAETECDTSFSSVNWQDHACSVSTDLSGLPVTSRHCCALPSGFRYDEEGHKRVDNLRQKKLDRHMKRAHHIYDVFLGVVSHVKPHEKGSHWVGCVWTAKRIKKRLDRLLRAQWCKAINWITFLFAFTSAASSIDDGTVEKRNFGSRGPFYPFKFITVNIRAPNLTMRWSEEALLMARNFMAREARNRRARR